MSRCLFLLLPGVTAFALQCECVMWGRTDVQLAVNFGCFLNDEPKKRKKSASSIVGVGNSKLNLV